MISLLSVHPHLLIIVILLRFGLGHCGSELGLDRLFLSLLDRYEVKLLWSSVDRIGSVQLIVRSLFDDMGGPSSGTCNDKDRREEISRHATLMVGGGGEEIEIWKNLLLGHHVILNRFGDLEQFWLAGWRLG